MTIETKEASTTSTGISKILNVRKEIDPCKKYTDTPEYPKHVIKAMGLLPSQIDVNSQISLLNQVVRVCSILLVDQHKLVNFEADADGVYECVPNVSCAFPIGVISRLVGGLFEAIFFYADGSVIVRDDFTFHADYYHFRMSN